MIGKQKGRRLEIAGVVISAMVGIVAVAALVVAGLWAPELGEAGPSRQRANTDTEQVRDPSDESDGGASASELDPVRYGASAVESVYTFDAGRSDRGSFLAGVASAFTEVPWDDWSVEDRAAALEGRQRETEDRLLPARDEWESLALANARSTARAEIASVRIDGGHELFRDGDFSRLRDAGIHDLTFRVAVTLEADDAEAGERVVTKRIVTQSVQLLCPDGGADARVGCQVLRFYPEPLA